MPTAVSPRLAAFAGAAPRLGVLTDVLVQGLEVFEALVFTHQLNDRGEQVIGSARGIGIGDLDVVLELGVEQVRPAFRLRDALRLDLLGVEAEAERAGIDADRALLSGVPLAQRPVVQVLVGRRSVFLRQPFLGRLKMRVARAAPPDVAAWIGRFRLELGVDLACRFAGHSDLDAGFLLKGVRHGAAPFLLDAAIHDERALLRLCGPRRQGDSRRRGEKPRPEP